MKDILIIITLAVFFTCSSIFAQDTNFVFWAYPNLPIPEEDTTGVIDTLHVPVDVAIADLNVYIGIDTHRWADLLIIDVISPSGDAVRLVNRSHARYYLNVWFDTQEPEDGPGELEGYNGFNSSGDWIIQAAQWTGHMDFIFQSWAVEIITQSTAAAEPGGDNLDFGMISAFPNPSNSTVKFEFALKERGLTCLDLFNILGQRIATMVKAELPAGRHSATWTSGGMASGTYYYILASGGGKSQGHITLLK